MVSPSEQPDYVDQFCQTFDGIAPELFIKWGAIISVAGALERKVWVHTKRSNLYPNIYAILVAPPGVGKTELTWRVQQMWAKLETHNVAHTSVTKASLVDLLAEKERKITDFTKKPPIYTFYSLLISSDELGVLLPSYDMEFMNTLTHLYDGKTYSESRRVSKIKYELERTNLNLFAACTPAYLKEMLPAGAWDQGFLSRVILIYADQMAPRSLFDVEEVDEAAERRLRKQLKNISELYGKYTFTREAAEFVDYWHMNGNKPAPTHPRLANYNTRRTAHLLKLSMISAAAASDELLITRPHVDRALSWLIEAEFFMPDIFKSMASGGDSQILEETYYHVYTLYMKENKRPIAEHRIVLFLQERTPAFNIVKILETLVSAKMLEETIERGIGKAYRPGEFRKIV